MNKTVTSDFGNFVLMTNIFEAPRLYETIELREYTVYTWCGTVIGKTRVINFAYESGSQIASITLLDQYIVQILLIHSSILK